MREEDGFTSMDADELRRFMQERKEGSFTVVDVRQPVEYSQGHIPGARHVPLGDLEKRLENLDPDQEHVFYCRSGKRSRMAARLAAESGRFRKAVHNLDGGILAWNGLALPDLPNLRPFEGAGTMRETLLAAMRLEKAAHRLYSDIRAASGRDEVCRLMDRLVDMELAHARQVYARLADHWSEHGGAEGPPPFEEFFRTLESDVLEGGRSVQDLQPWIEAVRNGDCMDLAELALEIEYGAYDQYRALAHRSQEAGQQDAQQVFLSLAAQEKAHAREIARHLDAFLDQGREG
jgi:rhodanese-related sulfurtransferase